MVRITSSSLFFSFSLSGSALFFWSSFQAGLWEIWCNWVPGNCNSDQRSQSMPGTLPWPGKSGKVRCEVISHDGMWLHLVTDGSGTLGDKEGLDSFHQTSKTLLSIEVEKVAARK